MSTAPNTVNLMELASACVACTAEASRKIRFIANMDGNDEGDLQNKNTRSKADGSVVTDADFTAQGIIVQAVQAVHSGVTIVGEESAEEMKEHTQPEDQTMIEERNALQDLAAKELWMRRWKNATSPLPLSSEMSDLSAAKEPTEQDLRDMIVDISRVRVIVDPLDGTKSYARGDYDDVSILIGIVLDDVDPVFGVVGKPFGYTDMNPMLDTHCVTIYGGSLVNGVFSAGVEEPITKSPLGERPRAVISSGRSAGIVRDFCMHLGTLGILDDKPLFVSGAGEKSLRIVLQANEEALWFFPKAGTSRWDVAAPDALLRALGGKLTDKLGNNLDYSKGREEAENDQGIVACIDADLHAKCIELFEAWAMDRDD